QLGAPPGPRDDGHGVAALDGVSRRVVASVPQSGEAGDERVGHRARTDVANESAHALLSPSLLWRADRRARCCGCWYEGHDTGPLTGSTPDGLLSPESPPGFGPTRNDRGQAGKASAEEFDQDRKSVVQGKSGGI